MRKRGYGMSSCVFVRGINSHLNQGLDHGADDAQHLCFRSDLQVRSPVFFVFHQSITNSTLHSIVARLLGTFVGGVMGLVTWYIGQFNLTILKKFAVLM